MQEIGEKYDIFVKNVVDFAGSIRNDRTIHRVLKPAERGRCNLSISSLQKFQMF
jgi:predicted RNA-binding protein with RPS1 domain